MSIQYPKSHHGSVPEYQMSGVPYVSSSHVLTDTTVIVFKFPYVARHVTIVNSGSGAVRVGFTENGVVATETANYFQVIANSSSPRLEIKCDKIFVRKNASDSQSNTVAVIAGLTNVGLDHFFDVTGSNGVAGVG